MEIANQFLINHKLTGYCQALEAEFHLIPEDRKEALTILTDYIMAKALTGNAVKLIVICTHNSRRSHLGQLWLAVGAAYYQVGNIETYSGGTEATAFNPRAVNTLQKIGFDILAKNEKDENPIYEIKWNEEMAPYQAFSKKYETAPNPTEDFAAIMVCTQADEGCPLVAGCDFRIALPYEDPKAFDDTSLEAEKYAERCRQIGREMLFVFSQIE